MVQYVGSLFLVLTSLKATLNIFDRCHIGVLFTFQKCSIFSKKFLTIGRGNPTRLSLVPPFPETCRRSCTFLTDVTLESCLRSRNRNRKTRQKERVHCGNQNKMDDTKTYTVTILVIPFTWFYLV
jgi:hypothetical protein